MAHPPFVLDPFQSEAIRHLDAGRSVLVSAPTGTGKTVVADHLVARALEAGRRVFYTAPVKALSNQKYRDWTRLHPEAQVGLVTGDLVIRRDAPCLVMTTEILRNMLLSGDLPAGLRHVVLDEIHFLDDPERGTTWEEVLLYLPPEVQILGLSATLSNLEEFAAWLTSVRGHEVVVVREDRRAVPLVLKICSRQEGLLEPAEFDAAHRRWVRATRTAPPAPRRDRLTGQTSGRPYGDRRLPGSKGPTTSHLDVVDRLHTEGWLPCLYFVFSRHLCEVFAQEAARRGPCLLAPEEVARVKGLVDRFEAEYGPDVLPPALGAAYARGVAFHHAGLHVRLKTLVEALYELGLTKVLYCTSTFALGINMPARSVAFDALRKYDGHSVVPLTVRQFLQKAGRAGRRGMDEVGLVAIRMGHDGWEAQRPLLRRYATAEPEPVRSAFNLSFHSVACLLHRHGCDRVHELLDRSFLTFQATRRGSGRREGRVWADFLARVALLKRARYVGPDLALRAGGHVLLQVQISEMLVAEAFLGGVLEDPDAPHLFALLCTLVGNLPRGSAVRAGSDRRARRALAAIARLRDGPVVRGADRLTGLPTPLAPELEPLGLLWARGVPLGDLVARVEAGMDVSGDLVSAFRRARDLLGQVAGLWQDRPDRVREIHACLKATGRDEVEVVD
ncbi:MAG: DEAD/DEAH box helicase [Deltaproteobacteria bacterium]|nr:DEAD/DEAH box helicase [Deltaproteobacteria bacterium]